MSKIYEYKGDDPGTHKHLITWHYGFQMIAIICVASTVCTIVNACN